MTADRRRPAEVDVATELVLAGPFGRDEAEEVSASCRRLAHDGAARLTLDVGAVTRCDAAGLACWLDLTRGASGAAVTLAGARWSQFLELLRRTPISDLPTVCVQVRGLVGSRPPHPLRAPTGRMTE